jgi:hypothetical protein
VSIEEIAKEAKEYAQKILFSLFGNDVELKGEKNELQA